MKQLLESHLSVIDKTHTHTNDYNINVNSCEKRVTEPNTIANGNYEKKLNTKLHCHSNCNDNDDKDDNDNDNDDDNDCDEEDSGEQV